MTLCLQQAQAATDFKQDQSQKWAQIETAWNKDILLLAPHLDRWSDAAVNLTTKFLDASANTISDLADAADNPKPPGTAVDGYIPGDWSPANVGKRITAGSEMEGQWAWATFPGLTDPFNKAAVAQGPFTLDPDKKIHEQALEQAGHLPTGLLGAIENIESSGGRNNVNPSNPNVLGAYQFDAPTAQQYGVDRHDEFSGEVGAAKKLADLYKNITTGVRQWPRYDGFGGLDEGTFSPSTAISGRSTLANSSGRARPEQYLRKVWSGGRAWIWIVGPMPTPKKATAESIDRLRQALQPVRELFSCEGGGSQFTTPAQSSRNNGGIPGQAAPYIVQVQVTPAPGSNVAVSAGGLPQ